jgi:hypothetical protein
MSDSGVPIALLLPGLQELSRVLNLNCTLLYSMASRINERFGLGFDGDMSSIAGDAGFEAD